LQRGATLPVHKGEVMLRRRSDWGSREPHIDAPGVEGMPWRIAEVNSCGRFLLADGLRHGTGSKVLSIALGVEEKDDNARFFYERESCLSFPKQPFKVIRPTTDLAKRFER
jgi:hypothetical protein